MENKYFWLIITLLLLCSLATLAGSVLIFNYLTMGKGIIWHNYIGTANWDNRYWWDNYAVPEAVFYSIIAASFITCIILVLRKNAMPQPIRWIIYIFLYISGWIIVSFKVSKSYIFEFGNTWTDYEIIREIVFANPPFCICTIGLSATINFIFIKYITMK